MYKLVLRLIEIVITGEIARGRNGATNLQTPINLPRNETIKTTISGRCLAHIPSNKTVYFIFFLKLSVTDEILIERRRPRAHTRQIVARPSTYCGGGGRSSSTVARTASAGKRLHARAKTTAPAAARVTRRTTRDRDNVLPLLLLPRLLLMILLLL